MTKIQPEMRSQGLVKLSTMSNGSTTRGTNQISIQGAEQAIDQYTAIELYTAASAQLNWESERRGTIQPRRLADLAAYRIDPVTCPVEQLLGLRPVFTMVGGRAVYDPETVIGKNPRQ